MNPTIAKLLIDAKANVNFGKGFSQTALYQCAPKLSRQHAT